ncbi:hypothetical protein ACH427_03655 [Streptomyces sp. NPDC020379]|uniref:hypothetical protein n=1 Tax=Streptomyces sp. NPDC020379 TaxID=3365071 RepID=UPI00379FD233
MGPTAAPTGPGGRSSNDLGRTLTAHLRGDAPPGPTAVALSLSVSAIRKRPARIEVPLDAR